MMKMCWVNFEPQRYFNTCLLSLIKSDYFSSNLLTAAFVLTIQNRRLEVSVRREKEKEYSVRLWAAVKLQTNYRKHLAWRHWKPPKGAEAIALKQEYQDRIKACQYRNLLEVIMSLRQL